MGHLVRVTALLLLVSPALAQPAAPHGTVATPLGARLDSALRAAEARGFSGVVRVERGGVLLLEKGYGLADRARRIPFTPATVVQIGSNTKDFTLVALLRLQERGRLRLTDSLARFFPDAPADKRGITLRQLVDHTGGFPIGLGDDFEPLSRDAFVRRALAAPLRAAPGTREIYSNTGYALLAAVIEQLTGKSYDEHVRDDLLAPLGLRETGYLLPRFDPRRLARGYERGEDRGTLLERPHAADGPYWNLRGNGGMLSTVGDMHTFYAALFGSDRLLPRAARAGRFDPDQPVGLAGSDLVNFFLYEREPGRGVEMIIATNSTEARAPMIRRELAPMLGLPIDVGAGGDAPAGPPPDATAPPPAAAAVVRDFVAAVNSGDSAAVRAFVASHFVLDDGPPLAQRVERLVAMHGRLGTLTVVAMWLGERDGVNASLTTAEGPATFIFDIEPAAPHRIRSLRVMVGG